MKLTPIYSQLPTSTLKQVAPASKSKSSFVVEPYRASYYRVNNRVGESGSKYSTSKKTDSSNGAVHTPSESSKDEIPESSDCSTEEQLLGDIEENLSNLDKQQFVKSKNATTYNTKRKWGEGNGYIEWRTITKKGKEYNQAYYHWKENGNKYSKYIPKKLLGVIEEADKQKLPVKEILCLLGVASNLTNHNVLVGSQNNTSTYNSSPSQSQTRRHKGDGSGYIQWKTVTVNGKQYSQAWYHYEFWNNRERFIKS